MGTAPEPVGQGAEVLSAAQVQRWHDEGAILVSGLFPSFEAAKAQAEAAYPAPGDVPAEEDAELPYDGDMQAASKAKNMKAVQQIMAAQPLPEISRFPHNAQRLVEINLLSVEPRLLSAAAQLLHGGQEGGEYELRLAQSSLMPEFEGSAEDDSRTTSSLVAPVEAEPDAIEVILYYADAEHAPGTALIMKADHPHVASAVPAGTRRLTQHIIMRKASSEWVSSDAPIRSLSGHGKMLGDILPAQRTALVSLIERPNPSAWACPISFAAGELLTRMAFLRRASPSPAIPTGGTRAPSRWRSGATRPSTRAPTSTARTARPSTSWSNSRRESAPPPRTSCRSACLRDLSGRHRGGCARRSRRRGRAGWC